MYIHGPHTRTGPFSAAGTPSGRTQFHCDRSQALNGVESASDKTLSETDAFMNARQAHTPTLALIPTPT